MRQPTLDELQTLINGQWVTTEAHAPLMCQTFPAPISISDIFDGLAIAYHYGESILVFGPDEVTDKQALAEFFMQHENLTIADPFNRL